MKHIYHLIKLKGVMSLFKKIRFKMSMEELDLSSSGIVFHSPGPATGNVPSPQVFSFEFGVARRR